MKKIFPLFLVTFFSFRLNGATHSEKENKLIHQISALITYNKTLQESLQNRKIQQQVVALLLELDEVNIAIENSLENVPAKLPLEVLLLQSRYPYANLGAVLQTYMDDKKLKPKILALIILKAIENILALNVIFSKLPVQALSLLKKDQEQLNKVSAALFNLLSIATETINTYTALSIQNTDKISAYAFEILNSISSAPAAILLEDIKKRIAQLKQQAQEQNDTALIKIVTQLETSLATSPEHSAEQPPAVPLPPEVPQTEPETTPQESSLAKALIEALKKLRDTSKTEHMAPEKEKTWQENLYDIIQKRRKSLQEADEETEETTQEDEWE
jgi:hypothetical protein